MYQEAIRTCKKKYSNYVARLKALWCRRSDWIIAFRDYACRGNFTNNYAEITVRLFKEIILLRSKTYNAAALVDFICGEMEQYYKNRLLDFAHCRNNKPYLILDEKISKAGYISSAASIVVNEDGTYLVPAESDSGKMHLVNASLGFCSCQYGQFGRFCKHAAAVSKFYLKSILNCPPVSAIDRQQMAIVAVGSKAQSAPFYRAMNECVLLAGEGVETETEPIRRATQSATDDCNMEYPNSDCASSSNELNQEKIQKTLKVSSFLKY